MERHSRQRVCQLAHGLHVAGLARRPLCGDHVRGLKAELASSYFVVNFMDYQFLQVFYPTRGILAWYDRAAGQVQPLSGADDPRYVQTNAVWSPDGKYLVFVRAEARDPMPAGRQAGRARQRPRRRRRSSTTSIGFPSMTARAGSPSLLRALRATA